MSELSFVSVNIERSKHLDRVLPFLKARRPEVVCIQELMEYDIPLYEKELGATSVFVGNTRHAAEGKPGVVGMGIFSTHPIRFHGAEYYWGDGSKLVEYDLSTIETRLSTENRMVLYGDIEKEGASFRIATTHFTWSPNGQPTDFQRANLRTMLAVLERMEEFALCGDFNAPRGSEIFDTLADRYKDNVPAEYAWSVDLDLHKRGRAHMLQEASNMNLPGLMVDGLFTTPRYNAKNVALHTGVSDHCAITATITDI